MYILGCDIGASSIKTVVLNEKNEILFKLYDLHKSAIEKVFNKHIAIVNKEFHSLIQYAGVSGALINDFNPEYKQNNISSLISGVKLIQPNCNSIIEIGGESASYISNIQTKPKFSLNCSCAAGTGSFFEDQLHRLNVSLDSIEEMIKKSTTTPLIAGRCSVFAKTDIIHRQQEGCSVEDIINGLSFSMVKNYKASIIRGNTIASPIIFSGGVSLNYGVRNAFSTILSKEEIIADENGPFYQAIGTALLSKRDKVNFNINDFKFFKVPIVKNALPQLVLKDKDYVKHNTVKYDKTLKHYLGIDIGSTSTNLVLINEKRQVVSIQYLRTEGRPLEVVNKGIKTLKDKYKDIKINAIGTTGSGRIYIAKQIGAKYVRDEITAQAKGVRENALEVDTIFEIGGQDSKFIKLNEDGVEDFLMNKFCAAGTGSFVEEQAKKLNIPLDEYGPLALQSKHPVLLGDRCTVFIQSSVDQSLSTGENIDDIASGVCYSIVHNYLHKVVGNREIGDNIYLSGGVCFNYGIVAAFKHYFPNLKVSKYFSVTGAIGIALISLEEELELHKKAKINIDEDAIEKNRNVFKETQSYFIGSYNGKIDKNKKTIGIPRALMNYKLFPMAYGFFKTLGFNVLLSPKSDEDIIRRSQSLAVEETCYPVKLILGHMDYLIEKKVDAIFMPSVYTMKHENSGVEHDYGCVFMQGSAKVLGDLLDLKGKNIKLLNPILAMHMGQPQLAKAMMEIGLSLGFSKTKCALAMAAGGKNLLNFTTKTTKLGKQLLSTIKSDEKVLVLVTRTYGIDDDVLSMGIKDTLLNYGYKVITLDHLPAHEEKFDDSYPNLYWPFAQHIVGGMKQIKENPNLYAIYLTNHGCGPDSMISHFVGEIMKDKPYLQIEVDEHYSSVGLVTRIEAFLSSIENSNKKYSNNNAFVNISKNYFTDMDKYLEKDTDSSILNIVNYYPYSIIYSNLLNSKGIRTRVLDETNSESLFKGKSEIRSKEYASMYSVIGDILHSNPCINDNYLIFQNKGAETDGLIARVCRTVLDRKGYSNNKIITLSIEDMHKNIDLLYTVIYGDLLLTLDSEKRDNFISNIPTKINIESLIAYINEEASYDYNIYLYGDPRCLFNRYLSNNYIKAIEKKGRVGYMSLTENILFILKENNRDIDFFIEEVNYFNSLINNKSPICNKEEANSYLINLQDEADKSVKQFSTLNGRFRMAKATEKGLPSIQFSPMYENLSILMEMMPNEQFINISIDGSNSEMEKIETYLEFK
ncbi:MAG: acyl-CoA dehydratase activase [Sphaerochaetaceae bacterium]|nr:acyl-CoA dehydratase activase [Sphaerochaetaceae bacterium]